MNWSIIQADAIDFLRSQPAGSVDLVFGSPPYEQARLYLESGKNLGVARKTEDWVAWMVKVFQASLYACKGLVAFVVEGQTRQFRYSAGPALLMADLHRAGVHLRKPPIFHRVGIPGSGGPDWLRNDWEWIVCASAGKLPWSDNVAKGEQCRYAPGGAMSHRLPDGLRVGERFRKHCTNGGKKDGDKVQTVVRDYLPPEKANPGNVIHCVVGGGRMGETGSFSEQSEAPFPESLPDFFVQSFCPPGGLVCDPFSGSGTTGSVAVRNGRRFTGCDLRASQVELGTKRIGQETPLGLYGDVP